MTTLLAAPQETSHALPLPSEEVSPVRQPSLSRWDLPRAVGAAAELALATREDPARLMRTFDQSAIPMLMLDGERRYVEANRPARLLFRRSLEELRALRVDDLTPEHELPLMKAVWAELLGQGCVASPYEVAFPDGSRLDVLFWGLADVVPGKHLIVFAPAGWPDDELAPSGSGIAGGRPAKLSPRELDVLHLAAAGLSGPQIAEQLFLSPATIKTHFANIYRKLGVADRAGAVARALRFCLID